LPKRLPPQPCVIEDGRFGAKAPPTEAHFCRNGFSRDPLRHREPGSRGCRSNLHRNPCAIEGGKFGAKAPPTEAHFCRSGFSCDPCVIENQRLGVIEAAFIATLASSRTEVRGESPSYKRSMITEENNRKKWPPGSCWISMRMIGWSALRSKARAFVDRSRLEVKGFPLAQRIRMEPAPASTGP
jgi:hypothetical protein